MTRARPNEEGFILVTALWLLLLCGAIVGLMMLRNAGRAEESRTQSKEVQARLDLDAALETIAADLTIRGPTSLWGQVPATGTLSINGSAIGIEISSDHGRLDLVSTDMAVIDRALQGLGVDASKRSAFEASLRKAREKQSIDAARSASILAHLDGVECPERWFTLYSGLSQPDENQISDELAHATGSTHSTEAGREPLKPGTSLRIDLKHPANSQLSALVRFNGESGGAKTYHGSGGIVPLRAA